MAKFNYEKLFDWLMEYYKFEFQDIAPEVKVRAINNAINNNASIFSKKKVLDFGGCSRCGLCCRLQHCNDYDPETKLCTRHNDQRYEICKTYPWAGPYGLDLTVNCVVVRDLFIEYLNIVFTRIQEGKNGE